MKTVGIVAEYNPFHKGHKYLIEQAKAKTGASRVVVVMSGNSVQRGDFAIVDKFARAKEAVLNGADMVVELPFCFCSQSAEHFAKGAVYILNAIGIDYLCFGSESDNIELIKNTAKIIVTNEDKIKKEISKISNENIAKRRQKALENIVLDKIDFDALNSSNDLLGIEYVKAIYGFGYDIEPISVQRQGNRYHDKGMGKVFSSATSIRNALTEGIFQGEVVRATTADMACYLINNRHNINSFDKYFDELKAIIIREEDLKEIFEVKEGIENLIKKSILNTSNLDNLIFSVKSKRYTYTRIRRILLNILIGLKKDDMAEILKFEDRIYTRVLAFNNNGRKVLKEIKECQDECSIENKDKQSKQIGNEILAKEEIDKIEKDNHQINDETENNTTENAIKDKKENLLSKNVCNIKIINKLGDFKPENKIQSLLYKYDSRVNMLYYSKFKIMANKNMVYADEQLSPVYVDNDF